MGLVDNPSGSIQMEECSIGGPCLGYARTFASTTGQLSLQWSSELTFLTLQASGFLEGS